MSGMPPIPGSPFFLDHLIGLLFLVHVLFMNYVLAAPFVASAMLLVSGKAAIPKVRMMAGTHTVAYTFAINSGVAVLLFVQVIYGKYFFTANTIMGWSWLALIALLLISFYGSYAFKSYLKRVSVNPRNAALIGLANGILLIAIAIIMITNYLIGTSEQQWRQLLLSPGIVHASQMFLPRFFHYLIGSVAVCGFWMSWIGEFKLGADSGNTDASALRKEGLHIASAATGVQVLTGIWFLFSVPADTLNRLLSGSFISMVWISGVISGLLMLAALSLAMVKQGKTIWQSIATGLLIWTIFGMIAGRDILRHSALGTDFNLKTMPYETQTGAMALFLVLLLLGIGVSIYLIRLVRPGQQK